MRWALVSVVLVGCLEPNEVPCGEITCPRDSVCLADRQTCAFPDAVAVCEAVADGTLCSTANVDGACDRGVCVDAVCGDGSVTGREQCDAADLKGTTCLDFGYYSAEGLACLGDCTFDRSGCTGFCGDGVRNGDEVCESSDLGTLDCTAAGFYVSEGLACTPICTLDTSACTDYCGDGAVNGPEICDGAPPAGLSCVTTGFDRGNLACSAICGVALSDCARVGWYNARPSMPPSISDVWLGEGFGFYVGASGSTAGLTNGTWQTLGTTNTGTLLSVWADAPDRAFAIGAGGLFRYDGMAWSQVPSTPFVAGGAVGGIGQDVYVASGKQIYDSSGGAFSLVHTAGASLTALYAGGSQAVYAVGLSGVIARLSAVGWTDETVPGVSVTLNDVWADAADDAIVIGDGGTLLVRTAGGPWVEEPSPVLSKLRRVAATSLNDVWLVAGEDTEAIRTFHFDGETWLEFAVPGTSNFGVDGLAVNSAGAVVASFVQLTVTLSANNRFVWAEGRPGSSSFVPEASAMAGRHAFAVGADGSNHALSHFDGLVWNLSLIPSAGNRLFDVWAASPTFAIAVGDTSYVWNGTSWTLENTGAAATLNAVWGTAPDDIYAVGNNLIRHFDGLWTSMAPPVATDLQLIDGSDATNIWAIGSNGVVLHKDATGWQQSVGLSGFTPKSLFAASPTAVYAVVKVNGVGTFSVRRFDGTSWQVVDTGLTGYATGNLGGSGPNDVYLATDLGVVHFDGARWSPIRLRSVVGVPSNVSASGDGFCVLGGFAADLQFRLGP